MLDKSGLTGKYDYTLDYAINLSGLQLPAQVASAGDAAGDPLPDLAAAVQKQLGLGLVAGKATLDVVVIDHINKVPTEN